MPRFWGPALFVVATLFPLAGRAADTIAIALHASGDLTAEARAEAPVDLGHSCSVAADPWARPMQPPDTRPAPYPFYRVIFGQAAAGAELDRPGPSLDLAVSNWKANDGQEAHGDPEFDAVEVVIQGRHFVGHASADPAWKFLVRFDPDGEGGAFTAGPLHETGTGHATITVDGTWRCPPVVEKPAPVATAAAVPAKPSKPAAPSPPPVELRLSMHGNAWQAVEAGKHPFLPHVDITPLHLAPDLRKQVYDGQIVLLVEAEVSHGRHPRVTALRLVGTEPRER